MVSVKLFLEIIGALVALLGLIACGLKIFYIIFDTIEDKKRKLRNQGIEDAGGQFLDAAYWLCSDKRKPYSDLFNKIGRSLMKNYRIDPSKLREDIDRIIENE